MSDRRRRLVFSTGRVSCQRRSLFFHFRCNSFGRMLHDPALRSAFLCLLMYQRSVIVEYIMSCHLKSWLNLHLTPGDFPASMQVFCHTSKPLEIRDKGTPEAFRESFTLDSHLPQEKGRAALREGEIRNIVFEIYLRPIPNAIQYNHIHNIKQGLPRILYFCWPKGY